MSWCIKSEVGSILLPDLQFHFQGYLENVNREDVVSEWWTPTVKAWIYHTRLCHFKSEAIDCLSLSLHFCWVGHDETCRLMSTVTCGFSDNASDEFRFTLQNSIRSHCTISLFQHTSTVYIFSLKHSYVKQQPQQQQQCQQKKYTRLSLASCSSQLENEMIHAHLQPYKLLLQQN